MRKLVFYIINAITLYRVLAASLLVGLLIKGNLDLFKWLLAISFFTDFIDGYLARKFSVTSVAGSRLDSIGDDLTVAVGIAGVVVFKPQFLQQQMVWVIVLACLFLVQTTLALYRYHRLSSFHTWLAKGAAILQGIFLIVFFFVSEPISILFYLAVISTAIDLIEEIILVFLLPEWRTDVKGLYWILSQKKDKNDHLQG